MLWDDSPNKAAARQATARDEAEAERLTASVLRLLRRRQLTRASQIDEQAHAPGGGVLLQVSVFKRDQHDDLPGNRLGREERRYLRSALKRGDLSASVVGWVDGVYCYRIS